MRGRVVGRQVVGRLDNAAAEVMRPDAVDDRLGAIGIVLAAEPLNDLVARILVGRHGGRLACTEQPELLRNLLAQRAFYIGEAAILAVARFIQDLSVYDPFGDIVPQILTATIL